MHRYSCRIQTPLFYDLRTTCHIHGWVNLAPFSWDSDDQTLSFAILLDHVAVEIIVRQVNDRRLLVTVYSLLKLTTEQKAAIDHGIIRALDLNTDTAELYELCRSINKAYGLMIKKGAGRLLRAPGLWEDAAKTLFTTNCSWHLTRQMCNAACSADFISVAVPGRFPFPAAKKIARLSEANIKRTMRVGYRAGFIKKLAGQLANRGRLSAIDSLDKDSLRLFFSNLAGFGPYATSHMMNLMGFYDDIPVDTVVKSYLLKFHNTDDACAFIDEHYAGWGKYRWWGLKLEQIRNHSNWLGD